MCIVSMIVTGEPAMSTAPIPYDVSADAVFHPERRPPLAMDASWAADAVTAEICRLSYFRFDEDAAVATIVGNAIAQAGYGAPAFFPEREAARASLMDTQVFAAIDRSGHAIVIFRGSQPDSLGDIGADLAFWKTRWDGVGRVHAGFWRALSGVRASIDDWLCSHPHNRLTMTGHSLGAGLATLLAGLNPNAELVTFGSPLVGDAEFTAAMFGRQIRRYVDCTDLVTALPPPFLGYEHVHGLRYIDAQGYLQPPETTPPLEADHDRAVRDYAPHLRLGNAPSRAYADHAPINYVSAILGRRSGP
jgi:hypothetical protein